MTQAANTYAQALYDLAKDEALGKTILEELTVLKDVFTQNPQYSKLLSAPDIPKQERCGILDEAFRGKVHPYVLNFLKILTEKGYVLIPLEVGANYFANEFLNGLPSGQILISNNDKPVDLTRPAE